MSDPVSAIASAIKEGLSSIKSYLETREVSYKIKMDKRMRKAIDYARKMREQIIRLGITDKDLLEYSDKFDKYDI